VDEGLGVHKCGGEVETLESAGAEVFKTKIKVFGERVV
jgi:hypothetical protein